MYMGVRRNFSKGGKVDILRTLEGTPVEKMRFISSNASLHMV